MSVSFLKVILKRNIALCASLLMMAWWFFCYRSLLFVADTYSNNNEDDLLCARPPGGTGKTPLSTSFAVLIPAISMNERRARRLHKILCGLEWPKLSSVSAHFMVDKLSLNLVEGILVGPLASCGFGNVTVNLDEESDKNSQQLQGGHANVRHEYKSQLRRRIALAKARNRLLKLSRKNEVTHYLWLDSDLKHVPPDTVMMLLEGKGDVVVPRCANANGKGAYDLNSWKETDKSRDILSKMDADTAVFEGYSATPDLGRSHMDDLANESAGKSYAVELDGVGGTMILVKKEAALCIDFPEEIYQHAVETEGFGLKARNKGFRVVGMPNVLITHA